MPASYKYVKRRNHPLAPPSGRLPEHRVILYEKIGPGPHPCHWCKKTLVWEKATRTEDGTITTDHLDENTRNNDPANLVPSCHTCNVERARDKRFTDGLFVINAQSGVREKAVERTCETCTKTFLIATKFVKQKKNAGRFCSRLCMYNRNAFAD